jgi:serine/threonine protein kinase
VIKFIDSGSFGEVYLVRHLITNMVFCLKSLKKSQFNEESIHQLIREIKIQSYANHPNIIKVYGYAFDTENVYILMEACLGKNLYHYIQRQLLPEEKVKNYMQQLSSALAYLHKNNIIHRDVKPENVLVDGDLVKLCDFGWAIHSPLMRGTRCGTPLYTPPEMIK